MLSTSPQRWSPNSRARSVPRTFVRFAVRKTSEKIEICAHAEDSLRLTRGSMSALLLPPPDVRCYVFASFSLDVHRRLLWRDGQRVPLTAKTFDVLLLLIANRHRVVTKDEFFSHVWVDTVVLEANLVRQISLLRRAFGQRADGHDFIITIPGRGYQFVA